MAQGCQRAAVHLAWGPLVLASIDLPCVWRPPGLQLPPRAHPAVMGPAAHWVWGAGHREGLSPPCPSGCLPWPGALPWCASFWGGPYAPPHGLEVSLIDKCSLWVLCGVPQAVPGVPKFLNTQHAGGSEPQNEVT